jgi:hypothetical protein
MIMLIAMAYEHPLTACADSDKKDSGATGISSSFTVTSLALAVLVVTVFF